MFYVFFSFFKVEGSWCLECFVFVLCLMFLLGFRGFRVWFFLGYLFFRVRLFGV